MQVIAGAHGEPTIFPLNDPINVSEDIFCLCVEHAGGPARAKFVFRSDDGLLYSEDHAFTSNELPNVAVTALST